MWNFRPVRLTPIFKGSLPFGVGADVDDLGDQKEPQGQAETGGGDQAGDGAGSGVAEGLDADQNAEDDAEDGEDGKEAGQFADFGGGIDGGILGRGLGHEGGVAGGGGGDFYGVGQGEIIVAIGAVAGVRLGDDGDVAGLALRAENFQRAGWQGIIHGSVPAAIRRSFS